MVIALIVIVVVVIGLVVFVISGFNRLRTTDIAAQEAIGGVDVQLTRRADLIPNLVNTVKGYAAHERGVFEAVTEARTRASAAAKGNDVGEKAAADQQLEPGPGQRDGGRRGLSRPQGEPAVPGPAAPARVTPRTRSPSRGSTTTTR